MRKIVGNRRASYQYESLSELGAFIAETPRKWRCRQSEDEQASSYWDLGAGYAGAVKMAREGWLEGARKAEAALAIFVPKDTAPDTVTDFYGHMPHVARYCAGAPDSMIRHAPQASAGGGKVLTLYVAVNANGGTSAEAMSNFGLGVAQYINELETVRRIRVELYGTATSDIMGWKVTQTWRIKSADQPLDLAVLAFSIGHPAMLRRLEFALCERCDAPQDSSYGHAGTTSLSDLIDPPSGAYVLNGMNRANTVARTPQLALEYVAGQIDKLLELPDAG